MLLLVCRVGCLGCLLAVSPVAAEKVKVYRDDFGVPHIYAETLTGAAFGAGYAQAEDRLEQLLQNYRLAAGTLAEIAGPGALEYDVRSRMWQHEAVCREKFASLDPRLQAACKAYVAGVERAMKDYPDRVPVWAQKLEPYFPIMLGRFIIWGWPEGQIADDLEQAGIKPAPLAYRGSNEWIVSPKRSALGAAIALIDPHLSWYGPFRFYEQRMYAPQDDFALSGAAILGVPFPGLGHSQHLSVAMTTGGPDTSDVYEETIRPGTPPEYLVDGQWRPTTVRKETIRVRGAKGVEEKTVEFVSTHHGPILAQQKEKAYAAAIPYMDQAGLIEELFRLFTATNMAEAKAALSSCQLMPQNVMVATVEGDIFYLRTGRVPVRNHGLPTDRPVPGHESKNDFAGIHTMEDLVQITNPPQGYMQNNNIAPAHLMKESPLRPEKFAQRPYLYNAPDGPAHQRAQMTLEQLAADDSVTLEEAVEIAFSTEVLGAGDWKQRIAAAQQKAGKGSSAEAAQVHRQIADWNHKSRPDSVGALSFYYFKMALGGKTSEAWDVPGEVSDDAISQALHAAAERLKADHGKLDAAFGDLFRVGREGGKETYPVGGGTLKEAGMATPRAISFKQNGKVRVGHSGQTSTQLVVLTKPPKSYMVLPLGESDDPQSKHWDDQAEKLFGPGQMKPTYFLDRSALEAAAESSKELEF